MLKCQHPARVEGKLVAAESLLRRGLRERAAQLLIQATDTRPFFVTALTPQQREGKARIQALARALTGIHLGY